MDTQSIYKHILLIHKSVAAVLVFLSIVLINFDSRNIFFPLLMRGAFSLIHIIQNFKKGPIFLKMVQI